MSNNDGSDTSEEDDPFDKSFRASKFTHFVGFKSLSINNQLPDNLYEAYSGKFGYWDDAINKEIKDMTKLGAIKLCAPVKGFKAIPTRFRFTIKADGIKKARMCARGDLQTEYGSTSSSVMNKMSLKIILAEAAHHDLDIYQYDVSQAFIQTKLRGPRQFIQVPKRLKSEDGSPYNEEWWELFVYLYGMKDAGYEWDQLHTSHMIAWGYERSAKDFQIYTRYLESGEVTRVGVHVDDGIVCGRQAEILRLIGLLEKTWKIKSMPVELYLGLNIIRDRPNKTLTIDQGNYIHSLRDKFGDLPAKDFQTPMESGFDAIPNSTDTPLSTDLPYSAIIGSLLYTTLTRMDVVYAVHMLASHVSTPYIKHWKAAKRILKYLLSTIHYKQRLGRFSETPLVAYADTNFMRETNMRSRCGGILLFYGTVIATLCSVQKLVAISTAEAEYITLNEVARFTIYGRQLLDTMGYDMSEPTSIYEDNKAAIAITENSKNHTRTKHIELRYHSTRDYIARKLIEIKYIHTDDMLADVFTKPLSRIKFKKFRSAMHIVSDDNKRSGKISRSFKSSVVIPTQRHLFNASKERGVGITNLFMGKEAGLFSYIKTPRVLRTSV